MSKQNDRALRFYHEVLGLEHLHYGIWSDADELTIEKLREAQRRYEDYLVEQLPKAAHKILDVGCGTSALAARLSKMGLEVEGLSPDITQKQIFSERLKVPFHHCRFEEFSPNKKYDCLVMSESAQYIPYGQLFENAGRCLGEKGCLLVCDYFIRKDARGVMAKSGHDLEQFMATSAANRFRIVKQEDLTDQVTKTLDLARLLVDKTVLALDIFSEKFRTRHPHVTRLLFFLFRKKINSAKEQLELLDSDQFKRSKRYMFFLFQREDVGANRP